MENFGVILAGGRGERFWPASRKNRPKQLLKLISDKTMLDETISRISMIVAKNNIILVTNEELKNLISQQIPALEETNFAIEPVPKNTAPAIGLSAAKIIAEHGDGIMFVLSSDHRIEPVSTFIEALKSAREIAINEDKLILLGIEPSWAETGYGYIEMGQARNENNGFTAFEVRSFKEKPNRVLAQEYYLDGRHLWNSGIFIWKASKILSEIDIHLPELGAKLHKYIDNYNQKEKILSEIFEGITPISIDYGVLEKSHSVAVLRAKFTWDDVGSYTALERILKKDNDGNVKVDKSCHMLDTYETTIINDAEGIVVTFGVSDLVIVRSHDVLLVMHKTRIPQMRELLDRIREIPDLEKYL